MSTSKIVITIWLFQILVHPLSAFSEKNDHILPVKSGTDSLYFTRFGNTLVFFHMTPEKDFLSRKLIDQVNEKLILTFIGKNQPCPPHEVSPLALKDSSSLSGDPQGLETLQRYGYKINNIAEDQMNVHLDVVSMDMRLIVNQDALKFHRPHLGQKNFQFSSDYAFFQDITIMDWQSAKGTFFALVVQPDGEAPDRFLFPCFPGEISGTLYVTSDYTNPFPFFSELAPIDYYAEHTAGSWKGKIITFTNTGFVHKNKIENACESATYFPTNFRKMSNCSKRSKNWEYTNGISLKEIPPQIFEKKNEGVYRMKDRESLTLVEIQPAELAIQSLRELFQIEGSFSCAFNLVKKSPGFSWFKNLGLEIHPSSTVVLINHSRQITGYDQFPICEDFTSRDLPWIQMYRFPLNMAMKVTGSILENIALSPIEELLYRDEKVDSTNCESSSLKEKIKSEISIYVFN